MAHALQIARVQAASLADAWAALHADVERFGSANNYAHPLLALDPAGALTAYAQREDDGEPAPEPDAWRTEARWLRNAWEFVFYAAPFAALAFSPVETWVARRKAFDARLKATPVSGLRALFVALASEEEDLAAERTWVQAAGDGAPFLSGRAPDEWPVREVRGNGATYLLLFDAHVSGL